MNTLPRFHWTANGRGEIIQCPKRINEAVRAACFRRVAMSAPSSPASSTPPAAAGRWRLLPGQALTLRPSQSGVLWVIAGSIWATTDGPHRGAGNDRGDRVFRTGETVDLQAGERIVLESVGAAARFGWDPAPPWPARRRSPSALLWRAALLVPASAVTAAMWFGAAAASSRHRVDLAGAPAAPAVAAQRAGDDCATRQVAAPHRSAPA
jgi:hypothetical protein